MAKLIQAIQAYGPRVDTTRTVQARELAEYIARGSALNPGEIENVLQELRDAIVFFTKQGMNVKLSNVGTFSPTVDLGGTFDVGVRLDTSIDGALNMPGAFTGEIVNRENIGKTSAMLKDLWNAANPGDLIP